MLTVLGLAAATLSVTVLWPQVRLSCRQRRTQGLSPAAAWLAVSLNVDWIVFALLVGNPVQAATHALVGAGNTAVLVALLVTRPEVRTARALRTGASAAAALLAAGAAALAAVRAGADPSAVTHVLGAVAGLAGVAAAVPQPLRLLLDRTQDLSGVAPARWWLAAASSLAWTGYGVGLGEPVIWLSAGFDLVCALAVCALLQTRRAPVRAPRPARTAVLAAA